MNGQSAGSGDLPARLEVPAKLGLGFQKRASFPAPAMSLLVLHPPDRCKLGLPKPQVWPVAGGPGGPAPGKDWTAEGFCSFPRDWCSRRARLPSPGCSPRCPLPSVHRSRSCRPGQWSPGGRRRRGPSAPTATPLEQPEMKVGCPACPAHHPAYLPSVSSKLALCRRVRPLAWVSSFPDPPLRGPSLLSATYEARKTLEQGLHQREASWCPRQGPQAL